MWFLSLVTQPPSFFFPPEYRQKTIVRAAGGKLYIVIPFTKQLIWLKWIFDLISLTIYAHFSSQNRGCEEIFPAAEVKKVDYSWSKYIQDTHLRKKKKYYREKKRIIAECSKLALRKWFKKVKNWLDTTYILHRCQIFLL